VPEPRSAAAQRRPVAAPPAPPCRPGVLRIRGGAASPRAGPRRHPGRHRLSRARPARARGASSLPARLVERGPGTQVLPTDRRGLRHPLQRDERLDRPRRHRQPGPERTRPPGTNQRIL
ncbi:MAG: Putative transcription regulator, partial [uncultured Acidimicrobiales bacterium]